MTNEDYEKILELLDKHTLKNAMMIGNIQYNLIDLYDFKKELKNLKKKDSEGILDLSNIDKNIIKR